MREVIDADGNPVDPAFLYEHESQALALAKEGDEEVDPEDT